MVEKETITTIHIQGYIIKKPIDLKAIIIQFGILFMSGQSIYHKCIE